MLGENFKRRRRGRGGVRGRGELRGVLEAGWLMEWGRVLRRRAEREGA